MRLCPFVNHWADKRGKWTQVKRTTYLSAESYSLATELGTWPRILFVGCSGNSTMCSHAWLQNSSGAAAPGPGHPCFKSHLELLDPHLRWKKSNDTLLTKQRGETKWWLRIPFRCYDVVFNKAKMGGHNRSRQMWTGMDCIFIQLGPQTQAIIQLAFSLSLTKILD